MNMATTRGCPYHCNWCAKPIYGQRYNTRSPENVAAELAFLKLTYRPDHIWFCDDIFGLKPGWIERFAEEVDRLDARIPFKCLLRVDLIKSGIPEALRHAGCEIVWVGAESGSQKILDAMDKGTSVEQIYSASRELHRVGIKIAFFLQFGYPGETRADVEKTLQMVRDCRPDDIGMSVSYPLPGTKFHDNVKAQLGEKQNWVDSGDFSMMYRGPFSTEFYRQLHVVLHREFRARREWQRARAAAGRSIGGRLRDKTHAAYNLALLPIERWRLDRLANTPHDGVGPLPPIMSPDAAATPSAQPD
jgi:anaerobic magnesium-protoporphyrin IX monomethyl ester cyclase